VAAPPVQAVMLDSLKYLGVKPDPEAPFTPGKPMPGLEFPPVKKAAVVPSVLGLPLAEAQSLLNKAGFKVETEGQGAVILDQIPYGDAKVEAGSTVLLYLGQEAGQPAVANWWQEEDEDIEAIQALQGRKPLTN